MRLCPLFVQKSGITCLFLHKVPWKSRCKSHFMESGGLAAAAKCIGRSLFCRQSLSGKSVLGLRQSFALLINVRQFEILQ